MEKDLLRERMQIRGGVLAQFLNGEKGGVFSKAPSSPARSRVLQLRDRFLQLQEHLNEMARTGSHVRAYSTFFPRSDEILPAWYGWWGSDKKVRRLLQETNRLLVRYTFQRTIPHTFPANPQEMPSVQTEVRAHEKSAREETLVVDMLLSLADGRVLDWVRQCEWRECKRWFMKSRSDRQFCSGKCLQADHVAQRDPDEEAAKMKLHRDRKNIEEQKAEKEARLEIARPSEKRQLRAAIEQLGRRLEVIRREKLRLAAASKLRKTKGSRDAKN